MMKVTKKYYYLFIGELFFFKFERKIAQGSPPSITDKLTPNEDIHS